MAKRHPLCFCGHARSHHRQIYGEPFTGACRGLFCKCEKYRPEVVTPLVDPFKETGRCAVIGLDVELSVEHVSHKSGHAFLIRARSGKSSKIISTFDGELGEKLPQLKDAWAQAVIDAIAQMVEVGR